MTQKKTPATKKAKQKQQKTLLDLKYDDAVEEIMRVEDKKVVWSLSSDREKQQIVIRETCDYLSEFLQGKNKSYDGSAFRDIVYAGKTIAAEETINVRITDKIRRLQSCDPNFNGEDAEMDLAGYLILKMALKRLNSRPA